MEYHDKIMERISEDNIKYIIGYHTQEHRGSHSTLQNPIKCIGEDAWIGTGYYFWTEVEFAHYWGQDFKMKTGAYDIYKAKLSYEKCINAVFDEEGYLFLREKVEETILYFNDKGISVNLQQVNDFLAENIWGNIGVEGIIYDDKPVNPRRKDRVYSVIPNLYYKKRIQVVIFNIENICNFTLYLQQQI